MEERCLFLQAEGYICLLFGLVCVLKTEGQRMSQKQTDESRDQSEYRQYYRALFGPYLATGSITKRLETVLARMACDAYLPPPPTLVAH